MRPLEPPPSIIKLVSNDIQSDSTWKTWLNNLYNSVLEIQQTGIENSMGNSNVSLFGNQISSESTPIIQNDFIYKVNTDLWDLKLNGGTADVDNHRLKLTAGAATDISAAIFTKVHIKYHSGTSNTVLFDAAFTIGAVGSQQIAGVGDISDGFGFGYLDADFGLFLTAYGHSEYQALDVTTGSSTAESVAITLDGVLVAVPVTNSGNSTITANEIAAHDYSLIGSGWSARAVNSIVEFRSFRATNFTGAFNMIATTASGLFVEALAGAVPTTTFVESSLFDTTVAIDPTFLNNYKINYQWGSGICDYYIQDPVTLDFIKVHTIKSIDNSLLPIINNPNLPLVYFIENSTNNTEMTIYSTNISGYSDGAITNKGLPHVSEGLKSGIPTNTETAIASILSPSLYSFVPNRITTRVHSISVSTETNNKPVIVKIYKNATLVDSSYSSVNVNTPILEDSAATGFSNGDMIFGANMGSSDEKTFFPEELVLLNEGESLTVTSISTQTSEVQVIFTFEDNI